MNQQLCKRDRRLDALRGLMLVIITIDHLPSAFAAFTYQSLGFVSAAEGLCFYQVTLLVWFTRLLR